MAGRIESYLHSDSITKNKGGVMIRVTCETDFAAKTDAFIDFCQQATKLIYACNEGTWSATIAEYPQLELRRLEVEALIKEEVKVTDITIFLLERRPW